MDAKLLKILGIVSMILGPIIGFLFAVMTTTDFSMVIILTAGFGLVGIILGVALLIAAKKKS